MRSTLFLYLIPFCLLSCSHMNTKNLTAPDAPQQPHKMEKLGDVRIDPYYWMNQRDHKEVLDYITAENNYQENVLKGAKPIAEDLFKEMKGRIKEDDATPPYKKGEYYYYSRYEKGKEYAIYCRKKESLDAKEEIILDINVLAKGKPYFSAGIVDISPNQEWITYAVDEVGRRFYNLYFKNLKTGETSSDIIENTTGNWVWAADNKTGFYAQQHPETLRSEKVFRFRLGQKKSTEVYFEKDEIFNVGVRKSLNGKTIFIDSESFDSGETRFLNAKDPNGKFKVFSKREHKHDYSVEDGGDGFYIRTNWKAKNFKLMKTPYSRTNKSAWKDWQPHRKEIYLENFAVFQDFIAFEVRQKGLVVIELVDRKTLKRQNIAFPEDSYVAGIGTNEEYDTTKLRYTYTSLVKPASVFDYDRSTQTSQLIKEQVVPTYQSALYETRRVWAKAEDGTEVPVSLVYKKDLFKKGQNPLLIYGYGSYGHSIDPSFRSNLVSLLDRGFVFAIAHIRGGQELGRDWYEKGRMMHKKNTFTDFIASTEFLLQEGYGKIGRVYAQGGSAGGLLMGAVINLRPDLYRGVHAAVPFVDVLTTMLDPSIPLTTGEYEQWGNPNQKRYYDYIKSYSPYDNISEQKYPHLFITTGYHDSQVQYWEPLKWIAKLRDKNQSQNFLLLKTEMDAGHSGVTGRFARTREVADEYSFFVWLEQQKNF